MRGLASMLCLNASVIVALTNWIFSAKERGRSY